MTARQAQAAARARALLASKLLRVRDRLIPGGQLFALASALRFDLFKMIERRTRGFDVFLRRNRLRLVHRRGVLHRRIGLRRGVSFLRRLGIRFRHSGIRFWRRRILRGVRSIRLVRRWRLLRRQRVRLLRRIRLSLHRLLRLRRLISRLRWLIRLLHRLTLRLRRARLCGLPVNLFLRRLRDWRRVVIWLWRDARVSVRRGRRGVPLYLWCNVRCLNAYGI